MHQPNTQSMKVTGIYQPKNIFEAIYFVSDNQDLYLLELMFGLSGSFDDFRCTGYHRNIFVLQSIGQRKLSYF